MVGVAAIGEPERQRVLHDARESARRPHRGFVDVGGIDDPARVTPGAAGGQCCPGGQSADEDETTFGRSPQLHAEADLVAAARVSSFNDELRHFRGRGCWFGASHDERDNALQRLGCRLSPACRQRKSADQDQRQQRGDDGDSDEPDNEAGNGVVRRLPYRTLAQRRRRKEFGIERPARAAVLGRDLTLEPIDLKR
jgi:hypothetical protein